MEQKKKIKEMTPEEKTAYDRENKRRQRNKEKAERQSSREAALAKIHADEVNREGLEDRKKANKCFPGEVSPGVDASTIADALQVCREFARVLNQPDVQPGESLYDFEKRVWNVWANQGGPFLNRKTQVLSPGWGNHWMVRDYWTQKPFEESWKPLSGAKKPLDVTSLSPLPPVPEPHKPPAPVELSTDASGTSDDEIRQRREQLLRQLGLNQSPYVPDDARRYLDGG
jgi:hypothetical protein